MTDIPLQLKLVQIENPDGLNLILGQSHFIKTVEDIHEVMVTGVPDAKFGLAFCESSGLALVRSTGTDDALKALAERNALAIGAGHSFILFLKDAYPINVLNALKLVPEVANIYCATANPLQVVLAESEQGRGILGVIDGVRTQGIEDADGVAWRVGFLRMIGYKAG
ncbi:MAG: adenosine-specific kinase [Chloroflexi bacterium]|nr:adenosine-specific kinase [Chloroflexota bacterium]